PRKALSFGGQIRVEPEVPTACLIGPFRALLNADQSSTKLPPRGIPQLLGLGPN
ncbi:unnamed protein product, partial [Dovyalis caffra]